MNHYSNRAPRENWWNQKIIQNFLSIVNPDVLFFRFFCSRTLALRLTDGKDILDLSYGVRERTHPLSLKYKFTRITFIEPNIRTWRPVPLVEQFAKDPISLTPQFDAIQMNMSLHKLRASEQEQILQSAHRLLRSGGYLIIVDLHKGPMVIAYFQKLIYLIFRAHKTRNFIDTNLLPKLVEIGFIGIERTLIAGGTLQRIVARIR
uniref:SAM-dependent methyltransferase n=1 Tax=Paulinella micropora TaxID=1928728 RepID=A0A385I1I6_9EUKA|nr:SAM-dependent methyltransferase [Paulinella micropora]AXY63797.1 SAM-dependent methyltransferase [Paulinella micropora]